MRIFEDDERKAASRTKPRPKSAIPRCRCGCGREALWPRDGRPVFHTRLCGYLMAVKMFRQRKV